MSAELAELRPYVVAIAAVFGALVGSFLNVCIVRWGAEPKQSVVRPRSRCPKCGGEIAWYDNMPVLSWLFLRGRCRGCGNSISVQYPVVEIVTAIIWAFMAARYGPTVEALRGALFGTILLGIGMTDARAYIIPDEFTLGGLSSGSPSAWPAAARGSSMQRSARRWGSSCSGASVRPAPGFSSRRQWAAGTSR